MRQEARRTEQKTENSEQVFYPLPVSLEVISKPQMSPQRREIPQKRKRVSSSFPLRLCGLLRFCPDDEVLKWLLRFTHRRWPVWRYVLIFFLPVSCLLSPVSVFAGQLPSLFRGVIVADSPIGVRVVSVEESSQAYQADLRPEDIIVRIEGQGLHSIDDFATVSSSLISRTMKARVVIFRNGEPLELALHLYSYPILRAWGIEFVPDHDMRFAQPQIGLEYWTRLGRGLEEVHNPAQALDACLNGLHNVPTDVATAIKVSSLFLELSQKRITDGALGEGAELLRQTLIVMEHLFDYKLSDEQLEAIKGQLTATRDLLRQTVAHGLSPKR